MYYDGTKLLSLMDINGVKPELYICTSNRTGGKTTYFNRLSINRFLKSGDKFIILKRFKEDLDGCAEEYFKDIGTLFFKNNDFKSIKRCKGLYYDLYLDDKHCGYCLALNSADKIKRKSHLFSDAMAIYFDEFQSETNHYCTNEVDKFQSIHTSVARGQGKQVRYVPVYLIGNPITLLNPYYVALDITNRLNENTHFLKGDGFVMEQGFVQSASDAQKESGFNRAFSKTKYSAYNSQAVYLNDTKTFIETPKGQGKYVATIKYKSESYAIREYRELGILYVSNKIDPTFPLKISITTDDHDVNYVLLKSYDNFITLWRFFFDRGCFRFQNLQCKEAIIKCLSY